MGQARKRFYGAFFVAVGLALSMPALTLIDQWRHGEALGLSVMGWFGVIVCSIGAAAERGGGLRWLFGFK